MGFEQFANLFDVNIKHYRADNGRFTDPGFKLACDASGQSLSFCRVSTHHQNCIAETSIRNIQDLTRVVLINTMQHWAEMVSVHLWPLALLDCVRLLNLTRFDPRGKTPYMNFTSSDILLQLSDEHA